MSAQDGAHSQLALTHYKSRGSSVGANSAIQAVPVPKYTRQKSLPSTQQRSASRLALLAGRSALQQARERLALQLTKIPRKTRRLLLIVVPISCILLANLIYFAVKVSVDFQGLANAGRKRSASEALGSLAAALMDEKDITALAMGSHAAAPVPLIGYLSPAQYATNNAINDAVNALGALAAPSSDFIADRPDLQGRINFLQHLADTRNGNLSVWRLQAAGVMAGNALAANTLPWGDVFLYYSNLIQLVRNWQLSVARIGLDRQRTQSTATFAATTVMRSEYFDLQFALSSLRGMSSLAIATGRWESDAMYESFFQALYMAPMLTTRLAQVGGADITNIMSILSSSECACVRHARCTQHGHASCAADSRVARYNLLSAAMEDTVWYAVPAPAYTSALGPCSLTTNASSGSGTTGRYIDTSSLLYVTLYSGKSSAGAAWSAFNDTTNVMTAYSSALLTYISGRTQADFDVVRNNAMNDVSYTVGISAAGFVICLVLYKLSERSSVLEVEAQEERSVARASEAFTNMMAHEMRNPLHGIRANLKELQDLLDEEPMDEDSVRHVVTDLSLSVGQLMRLSTDVLDMNRLRAGKMSIIWAPTDLWAIIRDTMHEFRSMAQESTVLIEYDVGRDLPALVWLDGSRVRQLISNGVTNAIKSIKVAKRKQDMMGRVIIRVRFLPLLSDSYDRELAESWLRGDLDDIIATQKSMLEAAASTTGQPVELHAESEEDSALRARENAKSGNSLGAWALSFFNPSAIIASAASFAASRASMRAAGSAKVMPAASPPGQRGSQGSLSNGNSASAAASLRARMHVAAAPNVASAQALTGSVIGTFLDDASLQRRHSRKRGHKSSKMPALPQLTPALPLEPAAGSSEETKDYIQDRHGTKRALVLQSNPVISVRAALSARRLQPDAPVASARSLSRMHGHPTGASIATAVSTTLMTRPQAREADPLRDSRVVSRSASCKASSASNTGPAASTLAPLAISDELGLRLVPKRTATDGRRPSQDASASGTIAPKHRTSITEHMKSMLFGTAAAAPGAVTGARAAVPVSSEEASEVLMEQGTQVLDMTEQRVVSSAPTAMNAAGSAGAATVASVKSKSKRTSAARAAAEQGREDVSPDEFIGAVYFEVVDTGIGLGNDDPEQKFVEFASTFGINSSGLGLPICRKLAQRMHGAVWLQNVPPDDPIFTEPPADEAAMLATSAAAVSPMHMTVGGAGFSAQSPDITAAVPPRATPVDAPLANQFSDRGVRSTQSGTPMQRAASGPEPVSPPVGATSVGSRTPAPDSRSSPYTGHETLHRIAINGGVASRGGHSMARASSASTPGPSLGLLSTSVRGGGDSPTVNITTDASPAEFRAALRAADRVSLLASSARLGDTTPPASDEPSMLYRHPLSVQLSDGHDSDDAGGDTAGRMLPAMSVPAIAPLRRKPVKRRVNRGITSTGLTSMDSERTRFAPSLTLDMNTGRAVQAVLLSAATQTRLLNEGRHGSGGYRHRSASVDAVDRTPHRVANPSRSVSPTADSSRARGVITSVDQAPAIVVSASVRQPGADTSHRHVSVSSTASVPSWLPAWARWSTTAEPTSAGGAKYEAPSAGVAALTGNGKAAPGHVTMQAVTSPTLDAPFATVDAAGGDAHDNSPMLKAASGPAASADRHVDTSVSDTVTGVRMAYTAAPAAQSLGTQLSLPTRVAAFALRPKPPVKLTGAKLCFVIPIIAPPVDDDDEEDGEMHLTPPHIHAVEAARTVVTAVAGGGGSDDDMGEVTEQGTPDLSARGGGASTRIVVHVHDATALVRKGTAASGNGRAISTGRLQAGMAAPDTAHAAPSAQGLNPLGASTTTLSAEPRVSAPDAHAGVLVSSTGPTTGVKKEVVTPAAPVVQGRRDSAASTASAAVAERMPVGASGRPLRVLFCDDEGVNLRIGERHLKRMGVNVVLADDGDQVLPAIRHAEDEGYPLDLLFLDVTMKRKHGNVVVRELLQLGIRIPAVAVTAEKDVAAVLASGFVSVVPKPFDREQLANALKQWVVRASAVD